MAVIRNTASMMHTGSVGNTTYYVQGGRQIARVAMNATNYGDSARRSEAQQGNRVKWANLVNFYKVSRLWMKDAFETRKRTQSDYNKFMSLNMNNARIYFTKDQASAGGCIADEFKISEGSLNPITIAKVSNQWATSIHLGSLTIGAETTVGQFTEAVLANNNFIFDGYQISFVSYQQDTDSAGIPRLICTPYEVTLDKTSSAILRDFLPNFCSAVVDGRLATSTDISTGAFAYVLSQSLEGRTRVSTQSLIVTENSFIDAYSSNTQLELAIKSYGVDGDVFLMSGSRPVRVSGQPVYLGGIIVNGTRVASGQTTTWSSVQGKPVTQVRIQLVGRVEEVTQIAFIPVDEELPLILTGSDIGYQDGWAFLTNSGLSKFSSWGQIIRTYSVTADSYTLQESPYSGINFGGLGA